jgi:hypothetical protein
MHSVSPHQSLKAPVPFESQLCLLLLGIIDPLSPPVLLLILNQLLTES